MNEATESVRTIGMILAALLTDEELIPRQTVVVRGSSIETIGAASEIALPAGVVVIDSRGQYLMPGLVDMHAHIYGTEDLVLLMASGVTSVRNMLAFPGWAGLFGFPEILALKSRIEQGKVPGPTIYSTGPVLEGRKPVSPVFTEVVKDPRAAERAVRQQHQKGYELIKVYDKLSPGAHERILAVAAELHVPVVGHVPKAVGIDAALASGQHSIEHLTGYIDNSAFVIPEERIEEYAARTAAAGIWNCPTLTIYDNLVPPSQLDQILSRPEARFVPGRERFLWKKTLQGVYEAEKAGTDYAGHMRELSRRMTRALHDVGATRGHSGVMVRGQWYPRQTLERMKEEL